MARIFRLFEKKRGERRTGSKKMGSAGEAIFFGLFFVGGCAGLVALFVSLVIPEWRANRHFVETTCTVVAKEIGQEMGGENVTYRPKIRIRYTAQGRGHETTTYDVNQQSLESRQKVQAILDRFQVGKQYSCWYDPMNPDRAVLVRGYSGWSYLFLLIPASFMALGGGGLIYTALHWGTSAERRAMLQQRARQIDLFDTGSEVGRDFPNVPDDSNLRNSPGTKLAFRLPIAISSGWTLFAALIACVLWNGIVSVFVVMAVNSHLRGQPEWLLTFFIVPFVLIGAWLLYYLLRQLLITTGVGPTWIEISHHPLYPGQEYEIVVVQAGRLSMNSLELTLACDEKATYRQGTDTRTETQRVFSQRVLLREAFEIQHGLPFEHQCPLCIPTEAMHSFKADHNEINWKLVVNGNVAGWPDYERTFPIIVYPAQSGSLSP